MVFQKEGEEKAMKDAADAAATSAALQDEAATSSVNPPTTTVADPPHVELPRDEAVQTTITGGAASSSAGPVSMEQAQFDVEITEATPKRSELEEKVRKINGPRSSDDELKRKDPASDEESDAVHTHEGEPMKSFEVPVPERDIVGVNSGVVVDPVKVQVARQKEIDSIARHEVVELVRTSECKQGTHVKGVWVEDNKGDIVRSRFVAKQVAYDQRDDVSQRTPALLIVRLLLSISVSIAPIFCPFGTFQAFTQ